MNCSPFKLRQSLLHSRFLPPLFALVLLALTGCQHATHLTTAAAGHEINADIVGTHSLETKNDQCVISSPSGKITIEATRVRFDDDAWTPIHETVPVKVRISKGKLWVSAGGTTTSRTID